MDIVPTPRAGFVYSLRVDLGFGYVRDNDVSEQYIFVFGFAISRKNGAELSIGQKVLFDISERGRVTNLRIT